MVERRTPEQFAAQMRALLGPPGPRGASCATVRVPTLVACGAEDALESRSRSTRRSRALVPGARLVVIRRLRPHGADGAPGRGRRRPASLARRNGRPSAQTARSRPRKHSPDVAPLPFPHAPPQGGHHERPHSLHPPPRAAGTRRRRRAGRAACPGSGHRPVQDRPDPADDRPVRLDRQADRRRLPPLHGSATATPSPAARSS